MVETRGVSCKINIFSTTDKKFHGSKIIVVGNQQSFRKRIFSNICKNGGGALHKAWQHIDVNKWNGLKFMYKA